MPIIDHSEVLELDWRTGYCKRNIAGEGEGVSVEFSIDVAQQGAGAPLHYHEEDELIVVLEGKLEVLLDDEVIEVGPGHTIAVPSGTPHGFKACELTTLFVFFPASRPFDRTHYVDGSRPNI